MMETVRRKSCRAILLTAAKEVFLIKIANPAGGWSGWITPGGGLDEGESEVAGLKRELKEELGFEFGNEPQKVWTRFHRFSWNEKTVEQQETFFLIHVKKFKVSSEISLTESEMLDFKEMRWWSWQELQSENEEFAPREFPKLLKRLIERGVPPEPIEVGI